MSECRQRHTSCCRRNVQTLTCLPAPSGAKPRHYSVSCCMIGSEIDPVILARIASAPSDGKPQHYSIRCCMIGSTINSEILSRIVSECRQQHSPCCRRNVQALACLPAPPGAKPQHYSISCCMIGSEIDPVPLACIVSECRPQHPSCCRRNVQALTCLRAPSGAKPRHYAIILHQMLYDWIGEECRQRHTPCCLRNEQALTRLQALSGAKPRHYSVSCCMIGSEIEPGILARIASAKRAGFDLFASTFGS